MGMKFTKIPSDTFEQLVLNAGILAKTFNPQTGIVGGLIGATSGGVSFTATPTYTDFGEDIDNCPKNMKELKKLESWEVKMGGTFVTVTVDTAKMLVAAGDKTVTGSVGKITPRNELLASDFEDLWWIGDYSDKNGETNGGFLAIHLLNSLSNGGFQIQSGDKAKGTLTFDFMGHYSMDAQDTVPFEIYVKDGEPEAGDYAMTVTSVAGSTTGKTAITTSVTKGTGENYVYQTGNGLSLPRKGIVLAGTAWSDWNGSAEISSTAGLDIVVAIKDSEGKAVHAGKTTVVVAEST